MPATQHSFVERPLPQTVALDTDFILTALVQSELFHARCASFTQVLVRERVRIVHSPLLLLEFLHAWQKAINRNAVPASAVLQQRLWNDPVGLRASLYILGEEYLNVYLDSFSRYEVRFSRALQRETRESMALHNLKPMDACLVASAQRAGTDHIVSLDSDFRRVDGIHLWNDSIPAKRQAARRRKRS